MNLIKKFLAIYFSATLIIIGLHITIGFFFETGSDVYINLIQKGTFTGYNEGVLSNYGIYIFLSDLFAKLQILSPQLNHLYIFTLFVFILITANLIYFSLYCLKERNDLITIPLSLTLLLLGIESFYTVETARTSMMLTGSSSLLLFVLFKENKLNTLGYIFFFSLSILGLLIRIESGILILTLVIPVSFVFSQKKLQFLKLVLPFIVAILALSIFLNTPQTKGEKAYTALRPYQFGLWDYDINTVGTNQLTGEDAIIYETARNFFIADPKYINTEFFERIGVQKADKTPSGILQLFKHAKPSKFINFYKTNQQQLVPLLFIYSLVMLYLLYYMDKPIGVLSIITFALGLIIAIAALMKMEMRIFQPLLYITLLLPFSFFKFEPSRTNHISISVFSFLLLAISSMFVLNQSINYLDKKEQLSKEVNVIKKNIYELEKNSIVLVDLFIFINWEQKLELHSNDKNNSNLVILDNFLMFLQKGQEQKIKNISQCEDYACFMSYLIHQTNKKIFLASSEIRKNMFDTYNANLYHVNFSYESIFSQPKESITGFNFGIDKLNLTPAK